MFPLSPQRKIGGKVVGCAVAFGQRIATYSAWVIPIAFGQRTAAY
jgi:hypothetical protein